MSDVACAEDDQSILISFSLSAKTQALLLHASKVPHRTRYLANVFTGFIKAFKAAVGESPGVLVRLVIPGVALAQELRADLATGRFRFDPWSPPSSVLT